VIFVYQISFLWSTAPAAGRTLPSPIALPTLLRMRGGGAPIENLKLIGRQKVRLSKKPNRYDPA
jgi:hypothetical protein